MPLRLMPVRASWCGALIYGVLVVLGASWQSLAAGESLIFPQRTITLTATPDQESVSARFAYANVGTRTVVITSIHSPCGCTSATPDRPSLRPGESGILTAVFALRGFHGKQTKTITLTSNDPEAAKVVLSMEVTLPPGPIIAPAMLTWVVGAPALPQTALVTVPEGCPYHVLGASSRDPRVSVTWEPAGGRTYRLTATPTETTTSFASELQLRTDGWQVYHLFAHIRPVAVGDVDTGAAAR